MNVRVQAPLSMVNVDKLTWAYATIYATHFSQSPQGEGRDWFTETCYVFRMIQKKTLNIEYPTNTYAKSLGCVTIDTAQL